MRTVISIWLPLSLLSATNNLDYVFEYFKNGVPSDDPIEYKIDSNINYTPRMDTSLYWIIPDGELPPDLNVLESNNNVAIEFFENRIFFAFRSSASVLYAPILNYSVLIYLMSLNHTLVPH